MAISNLSTAQTPLLDDASLYYKGRPVHRSNSGGWRYASFIIVVEIAERFANYGISSHLITFLTGPLGESTAVAATQVNAWSGASSLLPLLGAFIADSFLGQYRTIILAFLLCILVKQFPFLLLREFIMPGIWCLGLLSLLDALPSVSNSSDQSTDNIILSSSAQFQVTLFFFSLYLVAFGQGGHKPWVQAFGVDQFDRQDPEECKAQSSFFNWWYFSICAGTFITLWILTYIQDNLSWTLGFGIPAIVMVVGLLVFELGTTTYIYSIKGDEENPFLRIGRVFILAVRNWKTTSSAIAAEEEARGTLPTESSKQFKFLNKALLAPDGSKEQGKVCSTGEVEKAKTVIRLAPIWVASLFYAIVYAQMITFFTKQGATMDRSITAGFKIPAASLLSFISLTIMVFISIYDRIFVPLARALTRKPTGITMLQRIETRMLLSAISMLIAILVEMRRLKTAEECGLVDKPNVTVPMSIWWLLPQYILSGLSDVSVGLALYLSIFGVGSFLSSFFISAIEKMTGEGGQDSWFANNLNRAHLDYFYWLLAALSAMGLALYLCSAKSYIYARGSTL
ncbi:hypothetical protein E1A91_D05G295500v1 [Gossypium mustelinum]|uniref:Major facilitator superfamily (MFS) profile domain-containing protein n=1 Tax=Gossypium mustelinum TaxID=34275 RepID=A0A5D2V2H4_GOSMU|nr:hypothetical protein E1A91_D05G295500v1 [Gossypium mustelinum]